MKPLSFVIITYNRCNDMLALLENIAGLDDAGNLLEEIIIVNNCSTDDYSAVKNYVNNHKDLPFFYFEAPDNLGVAKGRNFALDKGKAPIIIMLDDDAELQNKDCLHQLMAAFENGKLPNEIAIVSFKVLYFDTLEMQKNALPHKKYDEHKDKSFFETYYYAGGAHAIKREILEEIGNYPAEFFYGMEEYDLSYRILDKGYSIVYSDKIVMLHKESPLGRKPKEEKIRMMWVNKSIVAYKYLPKKYFYSTAFMWSLFYLKETKFNISGFLKGWKQIGLIKKSYSRGPILNSTLNKLKTLQARLWY